MIVDELQTKKADENAHDEMPTLAKSSDLGMRFICRRNDGDFWYVQIRVMVDGKRHYLPGKSFYDRDYGGSDAALQEAINFRDEQAWPFFKKVGYDFFAWKEQKEAPKIKREPKFRKRKEATTGLLANLHYIHLYKKRGKYTRCVVDVTVNVHGNKYHSTAYSYDFSKYGGKVQAIKIAKNDRNKLAELVHRKAMELNNITPKSYEETKRIIKGVKINKTPPTLERNPDKFVRRSHSNDYWIVAIRKKIWGRYYRVPNKRFYDSDYGGKHKSKIKARKYAENVELTIIEEFEKLRQLNVTDQDEIQSRVDNIARDFKIE